MSVDIDNDEGDSGCDALWEQGEAPLAGVASTETWSRTR
jgi:hypothetical protein